MLFAATVALATPSGCTLPTNVVHASECSDGRTLTEGDTCVPKCQKGYRATITVITCQMGALDHATFDCVPLPRRLHRFRDGNCVQFDEAAFVTVTGSSSVVGGEITPATGLVQGHFPTVHTMGRLQPVEISAIIEAPVPGMVALALGSSLSNLELVIALTLTASTAEAALGSTDMVANAQLDNADEDLGAIFGDGSAHAVTVLLRPVGGKLEVTAWVDGLTFAYEVIAGTPALWDLVSGSGKPQRVYFSSNAMSAGVTVSDVEVCGVRAPSVWHSYTLVGRIRHCRERTALGNPQPELPGFWRPGACPAGVPRLLETEADPL